MGKDTERPDIFIKNTAHELPSWHVLYVKSRHEKKLAERLADNGVRVFLPLQKQLRQWSQRKKWVEVPLFPSYLFVKLRPHQLWALLSDPDVLTYVRFEGKAATVSEDTLLFIKKLLQSNTSFEVEKNTIAPGRKIKLKTGPFKGHEGVIKEVRGKKKLLVEIAAIQYSIIVEMKDLHPE